MTANWNLEDHEAQSGPHPELSGAYGAGPAGQSIIEGGEIPYRPEALAKRKANFQNRLKVDVSDDKTWHALGDPEMKCYLPGVPRATYMPFPFQIVQGTSPYILFAYEFTSATRVVRMDWKQEAPTDSWMGWSRGRWEGDTLVSTSPASARRRGSTGPATITATCFTWSSATRRPARTT